VLVVDEAGMVGTRQMEQLVAHVHEAGAKLVLVGDDRQLQAIDAGAPFAGMRRRFGGVEMTEIRRQREEWAKEIVRDFSRGEARSALRRLAERRLVTVGKTGREVRDAMVEDALEAARDVGFRETLVLTGTRSDARKLNREVQLQRRARGELGDERLRYDGTSFHQGDRIIFRKNAKKLGVSNGDRGDVVSVRGDGLTVRLDSGHRVTVHAEALDEVKLQLGYAATTHSSQGATVERAFVLAGGVMQDREASYVQASRARGETRIYMDRATAGEELAEVTRAMERSRAKDLALDLLEGSISQEMALA
jgi:ATP-dependent exoDNAse (exonuclease V) alpha subunit